MFKKVLIANRGEIACRVIRTLQKLGIRSVAVYSDADVHAMHVAMADEAFRIGPAPAAQSYLDGEQILRVAKQSGAQAIHPGYGFLSENADFAERCETSGIRFVGPAPEQIRSFGLKHFARDLAAKAHVPFLPGSRLLADAQDALKAAEEIGYPVMLKSTAGGGGIGLQLCRAGDDLVDRFETVKRLGETNFKHTGIYLERFVEIARHIEVQIFGDGEGKVLALGERDCSVQRRNQKVIEETPAPELSHKIRAELCDAATRLGESVNYASAGTVEFIYDTIARKFYFLEVNTRLQVEHGVTEEVSGIDLVEWMIRLAAGELAPLETLVPSMSGHSVQVRIYAEDPNKNFQPSSGLLTEVAFAADARVDTWIETGTEISPYYDPLIAKIIVKGNNRGEALAKLARAIQQTRIYGIETNQSYLQAVLRNDLFQRGEVSTKLLAQLEYRPVTIDVLEAGTQTSVQDYPGRLGYWAVGVPPSGPMDMFAFRVGNRLLGNSSDAAGLEITMSGPTLRFNTACDVCLTGAAMRVELDDEEISFWRVTQIQAGQLLKIGQLKNFGTRAYLTVRGGLDVPNYLESKSTFALGGFGGHGGRVLRSGDVLRLNADLSDIGLATSERQTPNTEPQTPSADIESVIPQYSDQWEVGVLYGPHGAPDFFTPEDIETFFAAEWKVHYNSNRTGVRLIGPKPKWARKDGGEAGLHPSNIHDVAYAVGAVDFTGDMPILLGPDGPSLGGFVCPAVVVDAELWKLGQLKAGDIVRFRRLTVAEAELLKEKQEQEIETLHRVPAVPVIRTGFATAASDEAVLVDLESAEDRPRVVYRGAGDSYLLVEYGPIVLDLNLRFRVHALMQWLQTKRLPGVVDLTPGIRSLQIHFDNTQLRLKQLLDALLDAESQLPRLDDIEVPTRIVHLPLSWEDESTLLAIQKYMQSVRADAPWCPSNLEFIRRVNGLDSIEAVKRIVFDASYLVLGLGDVYLGAPVATPLDPRHRLVTTKYNPARTWTPENAVGIGGAYLCIYGMEGPGGYQFVGRTVQVWNRFRRTKDFSQPWLLRFFDQIRFYPVSAAELLRNRESFLEGKFDIKIEEETFRLRDYNTFLREIAAETAVFKSKQQLAFEAERERWAATEFVPMTEEPEAQEEVALPENCSFVDAPIAGNLWKVLVEPGEIVNANQPVAIVESMKMEMQVCAIRDGKIRSVLCKEFTPVSPGQHLFILEPAS
ncbi:MAG: urea carboxylase [Verrucomicrobiota bacterium]